MNKRQRWVLVIFLAIFAIDMLVFTPARARTNSGIWVGRCLFYPISPYKLQYSTLPKSLGHPKPRRIRCDVDYARVGLDALILVIISTAFFVLFGFKKDIKGQGGPI